MKQERVRDRMHPEPAMVAWYDSAEAAFARMQASHTNAIPVVNDDRVIGIIERAAASACEDSGNWLGSVPVASLIRRGAFWCRATDTLAQALATMDRLEADALAVLDESGKVMGMIDRTHAVGVQPGLFAAGASL